MVKITKHGEDRFGQFLVEGVIGDMRFLGWQKGQKRKMGFMFFPFDPELKPVEAFGKENIEKLRREVKKAWMIVNQPRVYIKVNSHGDAWLMDDKPVLKAKEPAARLDS